MFVLSFRASTVRFFAVIALTVAVLIVAIAVGQSGAVVSAAADVDFDGIKTRFKTMFVAAPIKAVINEMLLFLVTV